MYLKKNMKMRIFYLDRFQGMMGMIRVEMIEYHDNLLKRLQYSGIG